VGGRRGALEGSACIDTHRLYYHSICLCLLGHHGWTMALPAYLPTVCITRCVAILACHDFGILSGAEQANLIDLTDLHKVFVSQG
jgi:hypothetical protein